MVNLYRMRQLMRYTIKARWKVEKEMARATKMTAIITGMPHGGAGHDQVADGGLPMSDLGLPRKGIDAVTAFFTDRKIIHGPFHVAVRKAEAMCRQGMDGQVQVFPVYAIFLKSSIVFEIDEPETETFDLDLPCIEDIPHFFLFFLFFRSGAKESLYVAA